MGSLLHGAIIIMVEVRNLLRYFYNTVFGLGFISNSNPDLNPNFALGEEAGLNYFVEMSFKYFPNEIDYNGRALIL